MESSLLFLFVYFVSSAIFIVSSERNLANLILIHRPFYNFFAFASSSFESSTTYASLNKTLTFLFIFLFIIIIISLPSNDQNLLRNVHREIPNLSRAVRVEFARGDGRVKRKEDERRKNIAPSETLFVVNFHEETTKKEDLEMLFSPYGEMVRIDMKRNYAFVQFKTIEQATRAKENTNGGKIDQSVLTVEYVARQRMNEPQRGSSRGRDTRGVGGGGGGRDRYPMDDRGRGPPRYDDRRSGGGGPYYGGGPPAAAPPIPRPAYGGGGGRYDDDRHGGGRGGGRGRSPSPPPYRRGRSRSRSPPPRYGGGRSRSPPSSSRRSYGDDYHRSGSYRRASSRSPSPPPRRGASPEQDRDFYRGDRDRGYRG